MAFRTPLLALAALLVPALLVPALSHAGEVVNREERQQQRIAHGVGSGQLTPGETAHLEGREARINASRDRDLAANGGHLTRSEHRTLNERENAASRKIYADKHNLRTDPGVAPR